MTDGPIWSYPKVWALGHRAVEGILDGAVSIQEKYDGSQISWAWVDGQLWIRSKGRAQYGPGVEGDKMFSAASSYLSGVTPIEGVVFRGEFFNKPKHNTLAYEAMPKNGLVLYDCELLDTPQSYWSDEVVAEHAVTLGIDHAQRISTTFDEQSEDEEVYVEGKYLTLPVLRNLLTIPSTLGGPMEGVVIKNYNKISEFDGKVMMAKVVSDDFKEKHTRSWKERNPSNQDVVSLLAASVNTEARFEKAVQHLRDSGQLEGSPRDIGLLMKEVKRDVLEEERDWLVEQVTKHILPQIEKQIGRGVPEWYKQKLAASAFA